jgi:murein DD-endopeptidase MepM/ murein hydrolase activator NlpD
MMRRRATFVLALSFAVVLAANGLPAGAQEPPTSDTSTSTTQPPDTTSTTAAPTTTTLPGDTTTTTVAAPPGTPPSTIVPPPVDDPNANSDASSTDIALDSASVPPRTGAYANQETFALAQAVRGSLRVARAEAVKTQADRDLAAARVHELEARLTSLEAKVSSLHTDQRSAIRDLEAAKREFADRAANAYMRGNIGSMATVLKAGDVNDYGNRVVLMQSVLTADDASVSRLNAAKAKVGKDVADTAETVLRTQRELVQARIEQVAADKAVQAAQFDLAVFSAGGQIAIHGFTFPVDDPHNFVDSFGAPRLVGTPDAHWHEGVDIMAPLGTRIFACERGLITRVGANRLGGNSVWLKGESGTYYYMAHLSAYVPGLAVGQVVEAGQVIGFVGNTGDAQGGPTHLHFEVHPDGGPAVDPYPLLKVVDDLRAKQIAATAPSPPTAPAN